MFWSDGSAFCVCFISFFKRSTFMKRFAFYTHGGYLRGCTPSLKAVTARFLACSYFITSI